MMTTPCFGISVGFSLLKGGFQKKNSQKSKGCGRSPQLKCGANVGVSNRMRKSHRYQKLLPLIEKYKHKREQGRGGRLRDIRMQPACQNCGYGGILGTP